MATQLIAVLCEGPHDVAFINKILKTIGFKSNEATKIGGFPKPMNDFLKTEVEKSDIESLNIQEVKQALLPSNTLYRDDSFLFLYSMGGDSKILSKAQPMLNKFISLSLKEEGGYDEALPKDTQLAMVFFLDADNKGVKARIDELNKEIEKNIGVKPFENSPFFEYSNVKLGVFVFTGSDNNTGKLEDILIPLMIENNEKIFNDAETYLNTNYDNKRVIYYDKTKSQIGVVGQLQNSGGSNAVCISKTDYINDIKINSNHKCIEIISFFEDFIKL